VAGLLLPNVGGEEYLSLASKKSVHGLFEEQAAKTPDSIAVSFGDERLTYGELNARADSLAAYLRSRGLGRDGVAGIRLERGVPAMVAALGILKAGGAYLPLDPAYPKERLDFMIEDSRASLLIDADLPVQPGVPTGVSSDPEDLAYVIYTSGSTGKPKGVAMPHRPLLNLLAWQESVLPGPARTLQFAPLSFDVSFQEMFSTWRGGGELVLIADADRRDPARLLSLLASRRIERLFLPFVALQQLAEAAGPVPESLRDVITAGEQLRITPRIVEFFEKLPGCSLHNHYGPSETHVVTAYTLQGPPAGWPPLPSIGRPIANTRIHLLEGELHVAGESLCRGYLYRPEMTAARFIPNPFEPPPSLLYKTGDLARFLPDGNIEYLGRSDDQVKIRGVRVELGEIETRLAHHPAVGEVVVVVRDGRLAAYIKPRADAPSAEELRRHLREALPEHFIPSTFTFLERLPLTPSGKIDRLALPVPRVSHAPVHFESERERGIAAIWQEVIGAAPGRDDNFFDVGGDSLRVNEVHRKLLAAFGGDFPVTALFEHTTIRALAAFLAPDSEAPQLSAAISERAQKQKAVLARKRLSRSMA